MDDIHDQWNNEVFKNRQREIQKTVNAFTNAVDQMCEEKSIQFDPVSSFEDDQENLDESQDFITSFNMNENVLLVINQIDELLKDSRKILAWFKARHIKTNPELMKLYTGLHSLIEFVTTLRIRAEKLLRVE